MLFVGSEPLRKSWCCRLQFGKWCVEEADVLKTEAAGSSETLAPVYWTVSRSFLQMFSLWVTRIDLRRVTSQGWSGG